jgi:DNA-binding protein YbaB
MLDALKMAGTLAGLMKNKDAVRAAAERVKAKLAEVRATGTAGGGAVTVTASGQLKILRVELSPALAAHMTADGSSRAAAEALIAEATNAAIGQAQARAHQEIAKEAEALGIPNIPGLESMLGV